MSDIASKRASQSHLRNVPYLLVIFGHSHEMNEILKVKNIFNFIIFHSPLPGNVSMSRGFGFGGGARGTARKYQRLNGT